MEIKLELTEKVKKALKEMLGGKVIAGELYEQFLRVHTPEELAALSEEMMKKGPVVMTPEEQAKVKAAYAGANLGKKPAEGYGCGYKPEEEPVKYV